MELARAVAGEENWGTTVELVPYHFCYTHHRLVTKYRGWDNISDED